MWDSGCGMQDAGCGMQDLGCGIQDVGSGFGMRDAGCGLDSKPIIGGNSRKQSRDQLLSCMQINDYFGTICHSIAV